MSFSRSAAEPTNPDDRTPDLGLRWGLSAFGLAISSELSLVGARQGWTPPGRHAVAIVKVDDGHPAVKHDPGRALTLAERRYSDGSLGMLVSREEGGSYQVQAPGHGLFTISEDGSQISCDALEPPSWRWQRPLYAQVLPLAATLHGYEMFHASAVIYEGRALGFVAPSGTGKTSLAMQLSARGASLLTDDVLSLELRAGSVLAYPGVPMANVASEQLEQLAPGARAEAGVPVGESDKVHLELSLPIREPVPLGAMFFLERSTAIERLVFEPVDPPDPRELLSATFMKHITDPARLVRQLDMCAQIGSAVPTFRMRAPAGISAADLAVAVERHVAGRL